MKVEIVRLLTLLEGDGHEARLVGGAVRDSILKLPLKDIDIATTRTPQEVIDLAKSHRIAFYPTGIDHGTITLVFEDHAYEITTLRADIETDGRHAKVAFTRSFIEDAKRRDFTMNALYQDKTGKIYDFGTGIADLKQKRVRFIGDANQRIKEDALRILRFFRFFARFGGEIDKEGLEACLNLKNLIPSLSKERLRDEFLRLLSENHAEIALQKMAHIVPLLLGDVTLQPFVSKDPILRLALLKVFTREDAQDLRERFKLSNAQFRRLDMIGAGWDKLTPHSTLNEAKAMLYLCGERGYLDRVTIASGRFGSIPQEFFALPENWSIPSFPISGSDLISKGLKEGEEVGNELKRLKSIWLSKGCKYD